MSAEYFANGYVDEPTESELQERWEADHLTPAEHSAIALELAAARSISIGGWSSITGAEVRHKGPTRVALIGNGLCAGTGRSA